MSPYRNWRGQINFTVSANPLTICASVLPSFSSTVHPALHFCLRSRFPHSFQSLVVPSVSRGLGASFALSSRLIISTPFCAEVLLLERSLTAGCRINHQYACYLPMSRLLSTRWACCRFLRSLLLLLNGRFLTKGDRRFGNPIASIAKQTH